MVYCLIGFPSPVCVDPSALPTRGPCSKYEISIPEGDFKGKISIKFEGDPFKVRNETLRGLYL